VFSLEIDIQACLSINQLVDQFTKGFCQGRFEKSRIIIIGW